MSEFTTIRNAQHLELLNQIARIATQDLRLRRMLQRITDTLLASSFDFEFIACATIDREKRTFVCEAVSTKVPTEVFVGYGRALGSGVVGEVAATGKPILIDDATKHANYIETLPGAKSELCVPVIYNGAVLAVINLESTRPAAFKDQLSFMENVADQVANVIASAYLYEEVQRRADHLQLMSDLARTAMEADGLQPLLEQVVSYVNGRMKLPFVALLLLDDKGTHLELAAHAGSLPINVTRGARWPITSGVVGRAVRLARPQLVKDIKSDPDYVPISPEICGQLAIPISYHNRILGVLNVETTTPDAFGGETTLVLRTFVDQVAGAIHMAQTNRTLTDLFSRYVAPDLAAQLLADPERFHNKGERRDASVLFADIRGFTHVTQRLDSEQVLALVNEFIPRLTDAIFTHRGSVNRYLGDGFMAVFGVPEKLDEHAVAALRAAREIQKRVDDLSPRWQEITGEPLRVVVVVNSGEVVVGSVGDPRHREFTVLGDVVNVASRLEGEAKSRNARIVVTSSVMDRAKGSAHAKPLGPVELRGREGTVYLFQVM